MNVLLESDYSINRISVSLSIFEKKLKNLNFAAILLAGWLAKSTYNFYSG